MRGITFHRPWISGAILAPAELGPKGIENRLIRPPECIQGKRFALHSGKKFDLDGLDFIIRTTKNSYAFKRGNGSWGYSPNWDREGIAATAICAGYIERSRVDHSIWKMTTFRVGAWDKLTYHESFPIPGQERWWIERRRNVAWILDDVRSVPSPIPCRGQQGPWHVPVEVEAELRRQGVLP